MRVLGIDLGERRIGVAVSDPSATLATPWGTIERSGDDGADLEALVEVAVELGVGRVVVGLPLSLDGRRRRAARAAQEVTDALGRALEGRAIPVESFDERLTSVSAQRALAGAGVRGPRQRDRIDQAAAAVLLQAWLDAHRPGRD